MRISDRPLAGPPHILGLYLSVAAFVFAAAAAGAEGEPLRVHGHTFVHQPASEAVALVELLLTPRGQVELQQERNTLVVRDTPETVSRIAELLKRFDHPLEDVRLEIQVLRAGPRRNVISPPSVVDPALPSERIPPQLVQRLQGLFRYDSYELLAEAQLSSREGQEVTYELGNAYSVRFKLGTILDGKRLKLQGFKVVKQLANPGVKGRQLEPRELVHTHLNLWMDQPFTLVLARDSSEREALMVAISVRAEGEP